MLCLATSTIYSIIRLRAANTAHVLNARVLLMVNLGRYDCVHCRVIIALKRIATLRKTVLLLLEQKCSSYFEEIFKFINDFM